MRVSLLVTCLVGQFHPEIGSGSIRVLERLGVPVEVPAGQTCCGQPAFNSGCPAEARAVARQFLAAFPGAEAIVAPSGSCAAMVKRHVPGLFPGGSAERAEAQALAQRTYELSQFLVDVLDVSDVGARFPHRVTYHDACHLLRDLGVADQPRRHSALTLVTGPSRTADIELTLSIGVHGPRALHVLVIEERAR